jgi:hypothetical protein
MTVTATATVPTDAAPRYVKQLASHLGRKATIEEQADGVVVVLTAGRCLLVATDTAVELSATAPDDESLETVKRVVGVHLERFGQRNELTVSWS